MLFTSCLELLTAPGRVLGPLFLTKNTRSPPTAHADLPGSELHGGSLVNAALRKVAKGQEGRAFKLLCSNGVAALSPQVEAELKRLHPARTAELKLPKPAHEQLVLDPAEVFDYLFSQATNSELSKDVFGWTPALLFTDRAAKPGFLHSFANFLTFLANNTTLFPEVCALLLSAGTLTPLHKTTPTEQRQREESALPPKIRPVNSGTLFAKAILSAVLHTSAAEQAAQQTAPYQMALGTSRGVEKIAHTCLAAYNQSYLVGKNDFSNGFNSMSRQAMLDTHALLFPEAVSVFNFFYGCKAPALCFDQENQITLVVSEEGSRQGCAAGTEAFCLGVTPVLHRLHEKYPEFALRILVDDLIPMVPPPEGNAPQSWQNLYRRYASFLTELKELAGALTGLSLNPEKGALLLPPTAPDPTPEVKALFDPNFTFERDGLRIAGAPVGTPAFIKNFLALKVAEATAKVQAVKVLGLKDIRVAHRLLVACASKLMLFLAAVVPPCFSVPFLHVFDCEVRAAFFELLGTETHSPDKRLARALLRVSLPPPVGCGLFNAADRARVAWWNSVSGCLEDELLFSLREGLAGYAENAHASLVDLFGSKESVHWQSISHLFPESSAGLLDGSLYGPGLPFTKCTKAVFRAFARQQIQSFQALVMPEEVDDFHLTQADAIDAFARSEASRVITEPLKMTFKLSRFANADYRNFLRYFLSLPPATLTGNHTEAEGFDYPVQRCLTTHGLRVSPFLDANANHACSNCPSTYAARQRKHQLLLRTLIIAAQQAGLQARAEPDTFSLLLGQFSREECRRIFPKVASAEHKAIFSATNKALEAAATEGLSQAQRQAIIQQQINLLPVPKTDQVGLRIDITIEDPATGETKWIDVTAIHTTSPSYTSKEFKALKKRAQTAAIAQHAKLPDPSLAEQSPNIADRAQDKRNKYARLLLVAKKQFKEGKRPSLPEFVPFVLADNGELGLDALQLQEWLVDKFRKANASISSNNGINPNQAARAFRRSLKLSTQYALAIGMGSMISSAGQAWKDLGPPL